MIKGFPIVISGNSHFLLIRYITFVDPVLGTTMIIKWPTDNIRPIFVVPGQGLDGAPVAELAAAAASNSVARKGVGVRVSPGAPILSITY